MNVSELKKKFPVIRSRDHGDRKKLGEIVEMLSQALEANASQESVTEIACDVLDREFLFGAWGARWDDHDMGLLRDLRGMIISAYGAGKARRKDQL